MKRSDYSAIAAALTCVLASGACVRTHSFDRPLDGALNDSIEDAMSELATDGPNDATDALALDAAAPAIPVLIAPMSATRVTGRSPAVIVEVDDPLATRVDVQLCADASCATVLANGSGSVSSVPSRVRVALSVNDPSNRPGAAFWRARSVASSGAASPYSAPWVLYRTHVYAAQSAIVGLVLDMDRDGRPEFAGGAPAAGTSTDAGSVRIHRTNAAGNGIESTPAVVLEDFSTHPDFGRAVFNAGDVNGDGFSDLLIIGSASSTSSVHSLFVAYGGPNLSSVTIASFLPGSAETGFAADVSGLGDVDGDGFGDVGVATAAGTTGTAHLDVYFGSADGLRSTVSARLDDPNAAADPGGTDAFGATVRMLGDLEGDGFGDFAVFAPNFDSPLGWFVYHGAATIRTSAILPMAQSTGDVGLGESADTGDIDGDGLVDLAIGAGRSVFFARQTVEHSFAAPTRIVLPTGSGGSGVIVLEDETTDTRSRIGASNGSATVPGVVLYACTATGCDMSPSTAIAVSGIPLAQNDTMPIQGFPPLGGRTSDAIVGGTSPSAMGFPGRVVVVNAPETTISDGLIISGARPGDGFGTALAASH